MRVAGSLHRQMCVCGHQPEDHATCGVCVECVAEDRADGAGAICHEYRKHLCDGGAPPDADPLSSPAGETTG